MSLGHSCHTHDGSGLFRRRTPGPVGLLTALKAVLAVPSPQPLCSVQLEEKVSATAELKEVLPMGLALVSEALLSRSQNSAAPARAAL